MQLPQIDPTLHKQLQLYCPQYKYKKEELASLDTTRKNLQIKLNTICITTYIAKYAQSVDEKLMLLHILNQPEYATVAEDAFTAILNREITHAQSIDQQYDTACLIAKYQGRGTVALKPETLCFIGSQYKENAQKAFNMYLLAAEREYKEAQHMVALLYERGEGTEVDINKACYWAGRAVENKNDPSAHYTFGRLLLLKEYSSRTEKEKQEKEAFIHLKLAADQKDKDAQYLLGKLYFEGRGTSRNEREAFHRFQELLPYYKYKDQSSTTGGAVYYSLGKMYLHGWGTRCKKRKGLKYLEKAANKGNSDAQLSLLCLKWPSIDEQERIKHLQALASESTHAQVILAQLYFKQAHAGIDAQSTLELAYNIAQGAAETGDPIAQLQWASLLDQQKKPEEALTYLALAARCADRTIHYGIANFYWERSNRTPEDEEQAISLHLSLANRGNTASMIKLTQYYLELGKNEEADYWLRYLEYSKDKLVLAVIDSIRIMREANTDLDQITEGLAPIPKEIEEGLSAVLPLIEEYSQVEPQPRDMSLSPSIPLTILQYRPEKLTNPKLLRQLARQAQYIAKKQQEIDALTQQRKNKESVSLRPHNLKTVEEIFHKKNVKLTLSDLNRLFSDPLFNNKITLKPTANGFIVEANIQNKTECLSTHWPHDGMLDPQFLHHLSKIIEKFIE